MEKATNYRIVFVTTKSYENAYQIAKILVSENIAACVSIVQNLISVFGWQNAIQERHEMLMMIKTSAEKLELIENRVTELHTDEVPEIISVELDRGNAPYLEWMQQVLQINNQIK
ncbi:MAG: divalent-cation tolerance protein CutA [Candidatus Kapaibacterium sp.]